MFMPISLRQRTSVHWIYLDRNGTDRQYRKIYAHKEWAIGNVSINLPFRSAPTLNFSWSERNGNTERFLPTSSKLLAMCPSVCRSAPPRMFMPISLRQRTSVHWISLDRNGTAIQRDLCPQGVSNWQCVHQFAIPLRSDTKFVLIGTEQQYREILAYFSFNSVLINVQGLRLTKV